MRTCHTLNDQGARCILRDVNLRVESTIPSFLLFMRLDGRERLSHLRSLQLEFVRYDQLRASLREFFVRLAPHSSLKRLRIFCPEAFFDCDRRLVDAIGALESIEELDIQPWAGIHCLRLLSTAKSRLVKVDIDRGVLTERYSRFNIVTAFKRFRDSLETLSVAGSVDITPGNTTYPRMRSLTLNDPGEVLRLHDLINVFPSLESLRVIMGDDPTRYRDDAMLDRMRAVNVVFQQTHHSWPAPMVELAASLAELYVLGISVPVRSLHIEQEYLFEEKQVGSATRMLRAVLDDARPLELHYEAPRLGCPFLKDPEFLSVFSETRDPPMNELWFNVDVSRDRYSSADLCDVLVSL